MREIVTVIGSGIVGKSWAMLFASGGHQVRLYDTDQEALRLGLSEVRQKLQSLEENGDLKSSDELSAKEQGALISAAVDLNEALKGCTYIQECTPENLGTKKAVFAMLDTALTSLADEKVIIGSSSSAIPASKFAYGLKIESRSLVVHPINPLYFMRFVELVPHPRTDPDVTMKVRNLLTDLGQKPIVLKKECEGFAQNRIQYAILNATWGLVKDGILSVEDADMVTKEGLAPRYVFMGPLETAQLNADGFVNYCERYGDTIYNVSVESQSTIPKFTAEGAKDIDASLQALVPNSELGRRRQWRDENLAKLARFKSKVDL